MIPSSYEIDDIRNITDIRETEVSDHKAHLIAIFSVWKLYISLYHCFTAQLHRVFIMRTLSLNYF